MLTVCPSVTIDFAPNQRGDIKPLGQTQIPSQLNPGNHQRIYLHGIDMSDVGAMNPEQIDKYIESEIWHIECYLAHPHETQDATWDRWPV